MTTTLPDVIHSAPEPILVRYPKQRDDTKGMRGKLFHVPTQDFLGVVIREELDDYPGCVLIMPVSPGHFEFDQGNAYVFSHGEAIRFVEVTHVVRPERSFGHSPSWEPLTEMEPMRRSRTKRIIDRGLWELA